MAKEYLSEQGYPLLLGLPVDICIFTVTATPKSGSAHVDKRTLRGLPTRTLELVLVKRHEEPFSNQWALPGGFTDVRRESLLEAAARELMEETHVDVRKVPNEAFEQLRAYYAPERDPRGYTPTVAFVALINESYVSNMQSSGDASEAKLFKVEQVEGQVTRLTSRDGEVLSLADLAFDHGIIIQDAVLHIRRKVLQTTVASALLQDTFTLAELQKVIEAIVPEFTNKVSPSNFARDVRTAKIRYGLLEEVIGPDGQHMTSDEYSTRPAKLYRFAHYQVPVSIYPGYEPRLR